MASRKLLNGVCHNIAHHAVSGLSFIHPHLRKACRTLKISSVVVDLGKEQPCPDVLMSNEPLRNSIVHLQKRFWEMVAAEGSLPDDIESIVLQFEFPKGFDDYCANCHAQMILKSGKVYRHSVNPFGETIAPTSATKNGDSGVSRHF